MVRWNSKNVGSAHDPIESIASVAPIPFYRENAKGRKRERRRKKFLFQWFPSEMIVSSHSKESTLAEAVPIFQKYFSRFRPFAFSRFIPSYFHFLSVK